MPAAPYAGMAAIHDDPGAVKADYRLSMGGIGEVLDDDSRRTRGAEPLMPGIPVFGVDLPDEWMIRLPVSTGTRT